MVFCLICWTNALVDAISARKLSTASPMSAGTNSAFSEMLGVEPAVVDGTVPSGDMAIIISLRPRSTTSFSNSETPRRISASSLPNSASASAARVPSLSLMVSASARPMKKASSKSKLSFAASFLLISVIK